MSLSAINIGTTMVHFAGLYHTGNIRPVSSTLYNKVQVCTFIDLMHVLDMLYTTSNVMCVSEFTFKNMMHILGLFCELPVSLTCDVMKLRSS